MRNPPPLSRGGAGGGDQTATHIQSSNEFLTPKHSTEHPPPTPPSGEGGEIRFQSIVDDSTPITQRYKLTLAYDGSAYHGWQKQEPPDGEPLPTVAGVVEQAIIHTLAQPINLVGASRTDTGVHALGQSAHFDAVSRVPVERLAHAINSRLPDDIEVRSAEIADPGFDAIRGAIEKQYRYRIFNSSRRPLDRRNYVYHCWHNLDIDRMNEAAQKLVGTHDFEGLSAAGHGRTSTVRTVFACHAEKHTQLDEIHIVVRGDGFLYNMVRILSGTLLDVGRGRFGPDVADRILATADRREAGPTLPPTGLWLEWIRY
ncbi:MAG: tRNA pseudouridine(38-40) synthase TruA [Phycisphaera sp.]|nr:tRNA pseudouridine(38-40) synthase TruA [Phycisphaera sp.]